MATAKVEEEVDDDDDDDEEEEEVVEREFEFPRGVKEKKPPVLGPCFGVSTDIDKLDWTGFDGVEIVEESDSEVVVVVLWAVVDVVDVVEVDVEEELEIANPRTAARASSKSWSNTWVSLNLKVRARNLTFSRALAQSKEPTDR